MNIAQVLAAARKKFDNNSKKQVFKRPIDLFLIEATVTGEVMDLEIKKYTVRNMKELQMLKDREQDWARPLKTGEFLRMGRASIDQQIMTELMMEVLLKK